MMKAQMAALILMLIGCSTAQCHKPAQIQKDEAPMSTEKLLAGPGRALVAKADGARYCDTPDNNFTKSLEATKVQLKDIKVYEMAKQNDGRMHSQACGTFAGNYNVYEIAEEDLKKALGLGFVLWPLMKKGSLQ